MSLKFALPLAIATACLPFVGTSHGQIYTETGDAGSLPATAQTITGVAGVTYTSITGTTTASNGIFDSDMYQITLAATTGFTASTTGFAVGANNFDTQLFLFNSSGVGIVANDDAGDSEQSSLTTGTTLLAPGTYYLLIAGSGNYPIDSTGALIFPNINDGTTTSASGNYAATSALPIAGYTGNSDEGGKYVISLSYALPAGVPEPSSFAALAAGLGGLTFVLRRRSK